MNLETLQTQWRRAVDDSEEWELELKGSPAWVDCDEQQVGGGDLDDEPSPN